MKKKYIVTIDGNATIKRTVVVEADHEDEAEDLALEGEGTVTHEETNLFEIIGCDIEEADHG